jgi:hypothetical protein
MSAKLVVDADGNIVEYAPAPVASPTRQQAKTQGVPRKSRAAEMWDDYTQAVKENVQRDGAILNRVREGFTLGIAEPISAGIIGGVQALQDGTDIRDEYRAERGRMARRSARIRQQAGLAGEVGQFVGGMAAPLGTGQRAVDTVNKIRKGAGAAKELGRVGQYVTRGTQQGAISGGITSLAQQDDLSNLPRVVGEVGRDMLAGGAGGAALGFVAPAAATAVAGVKRLLPGGRFGAARGAVEEAQANILDQVNRASDIPAAERRVAEMREQGVGPVLADVSRATQDNVRALSDLGVRGADEIAEKLDIRSERRGGRLRNVMEQISGINSSVTAAEFKRGQQTARKAIGESQYAVGGALDTPFLLTPQQNKALMSRAVPGNPADRTFRKFYEDALETYNANPNNIPHKRWNIAPSGRVMDETLRLYRQRINQLYKSGQGNEGAALRAQFDALREGLRRQNPEYADILDFQARGLAKERAIDEAGKIAAGIFSKPREVLDALRQVGHPEDVNAMRGVLADRLFRETGNRRAHTQIKRALADPNQPEARQVIDFIMGGPERTAKLQKWLDAEAPAIRTEGRLGGPNTSTNQMAMLNAVGADMESAGANVARLGAGIVTGSPGMATNAGALSYKYGKRLSDMVRRMQVAPAELKLLRKDVKEGDLTRMERRVLQRAAKRAARRAGPAAAAGRGGGYAVANVTRPGNTYEDEEQ